MLHAESASLMERVKRELLRRRGNVDLVGMFSSSGECEGDPNPNFAKVDGNLVEMGFHSKQQVTKYLTQRNQRWGGGSFGGIHVSEG